MLAWGTDFDVSVFELDTCMLTEPRAAFKELYVQAP